MIDFSHNSDPATQDLNLLQLPHRIQHVVAVCLVHILPVTFTVHFLGILYFIKNFLQNDCPSFKRRVLQLLPAECTDGDAFLRYGRLSGLLGTPINLLFRLSLFHRRVLFVVFKKSLRQLHPPLDYSHFLHFLVLQVELLGHHVDGKLAKMADVHPLRGVELDDQGLEPVDDSSLSDAPKSGGLDRVSLLYNDIPHNSSVKWLFLPH